MKSNPFAVFALILASALASGSGCSKQSRAERHVTRGVQNVSAGALDLAEKEYAAALALVPDYAAALGKMGVLYYQQGRLLPAYAFLDRTLKAAPEDIDARLAFGWISNSMARTAAARDAARAVLEKRPTDELALLLLAETSATARDNEESRRIIEELRVAHKDTPGFHVALASLSLARRDAAGAEAEIKKALQLDPKSSSAQAHLGALHLLQQNPAKASEAFKAASDLSPPRSPRRIKYVEFLLQTGSTETAKRELTAIVEKSPDFIPALALQMKISFDERRYAETTTLAEKILARDRSNYDALLQNAAAKLAQGDAPGAIAALKHMEQFYPNSPVVNYRMARAHVAKADFAAAEQNLQQAIQLNPAYDEAILLLAEINLFRGNPTLALSALNQLVKRQPRLPRAYALLGRAHETQGNLDESLKMFRVYSEASPRSAEGPYFAATVLAQLGKKDEARLAFEQSLQRAPDYWPAVEALVNYDLQDKKPAAAMARVQPLMEKFSNVAVPHMLSAKIRLQEGNLAGAESDLLKALESDPKEQQAYLLLARNYLTSNKGQQAVDTMKALAAKTNRPGAYMQLGVLHNTLKQFDAAKVAYEKALEVDPNFHPALNNLALLLSEVPAQLEKAESLAKRARELAPANPVVTDTAGWILFRKGQFENALPLLRTSAEKLPLEPEVQFHLAMTHYHLGQEQPARQAFQQVLASPADSPVKEEARRRLAVLTINPATADASIRAELEGRTQRERNDPVALIKLAAIEARSGANEKAAAHYEAALALNPNSAGTLLALAQLHAGPLKNPARARELGKKAQAAAPFDGEIAWSVGRIALGLRDYPWASTLLQTATQTLTSQPTLLMDLARAQYGVGRLPDTEQSLKQILDASPPPAIRDEAQRLASMISATKSPAQVQAALADARKVLAAEADHIPALMIVALAAENQGEHRGAKQSYEKILGQNPTFAPATLRLGILHGDHLGDDKQAEELLTKVRSVFPDDPELAYALGTVNYRKRDYTAAIRFLSQSARQQPKQAESCFFLGLSHFQLKNVPDARTQLQRALQLNLSAIEATEAKRVLEELNKMPGGR